MSADRVLIAFASQQGSTAWVAEMICKELRAAGLAVECRPAATVADLEPFGAVVLGSGVFLARRGSDGGGFITRHRASLANRSVWLFSAGPIGGIGQGGNGGPDDDEAPVIRVAREIGARGAATFGAAPLVDGHDDARRSATDWREVARVRSWARAIADELGRAGPRRAVRAPRRPAPPRTSISPGRPIVVTR